MSDDDLKKPVEGDEKKTGHETPSSEEPSRAPFSEPKTESVEKEIDPHAIAEEPSVKENPDKTKTGDDRETEKIEVVAPIVEKVPSINEMYAEKLSEDKDPDPPKEPEPHDPAEEVSVSTPDYESEYDIFSEEPKVKPTKQVGPPSPPPLPPKDKWAPLKSAHKNIVKGLWYLLAAAFVGMILLFVVLSFSDLPDTQALENPRSELASQIYSDAGEVLGRYFVENRVPVDYDELSPNVRYALIATEDERYYNHCGIDFRGLGRVAFKTVLLQQRSSGGASTITQQLAKLLFTGRKASGFKRVIQKLKEWIIAVRLERKYTKQEIMTMYLNKFDFLYDSHGIKAAAETYFGKSQDSLKIEEAAMLVGMLKNPSLFNPRRRPDTVRHRREVVLKQMRRNDLLTRAEYDSIRNLPLDISNFTRKTHTVGLAQYFRMELGKYLKELLKSDLTRKKVDGEPYDIYTDGLKIYTTIDPVFQEHAEKAMWETMSALQKKFNRYWTSRSKNPWTYRDAETTPGELRARERKLKQLIQSSDRYGAMRANFLPSEVLSDLEEKISGLQLRDIDIERMIEAEKDQAHLRRLQSRNLISEEMAKQYRRAIKTEEWDTLKSQWEKLQKAVDEVFDKPVKMKVFAYNDKMETDTVLSPLDSIKYHHNFLQIGSIAVDPRTGYVKAWIGGINQKYFSFDHTGTNRQVGSTFKPFVYASAIQHLGVSPCEQVVDLPRTIFPNENGFDLLEPWTPKNSSGEYTGERMTLKNALRKSVNSVSVALMKRLGSTKEVRNLANRMGIDVDRQYPNGQLRVPDAPSICLGSCDLKVIEMAGAYSAFANNGTYIKPVFVKKIEDKNGREIYKAELEDELALEPDKNYVMTEMLKYASGGLGLKSQVGGKTGTTNDYVDGWFVGITPTLVVGTWVGGEDRWIRFLDLSNGQGARMARPFFIEFIKSLEEDEESGYDFRASFPEPDMPVNIELDCDLYRQPLNILDDRFENSDGGFFEDQFGDEIETKRDTTEQENSNDG